MVSMTRFRTAASALALVAAPAGGQNVVPDELLVRVDRAYAPSVTAAIAAVGRPTPDVLKSGETLRDAIVRRCGTMEAVYLAAFIKENFPGGIADEAQLAQLSAGVTYQFPACLFSPAKERKVARNENPWAIYKSMAVPFDGSALRLETGGELAPLTGAFKTAVKAFDVSRPATPGLIAAGRGFDSTEAAKTFASRNAGVDPTRLNASAASTLLVPADVRSGIIEIRPGLSIGLARQRVEGALAALEPLAGDSGSARKGVVDDVTLAELIDPVSYVGPCTWPGGSPIPVKDFEAGRAENERLRGRPPERAKVLVIDTGYDERLREPAIFERDLGNLAAFGSDDDPNHYHGFNPVDQDRFNDPTPQAGWAAGMHGGQVAATMLGGRFLPPADRTAPALEVTFASIAKGTTLRAEGATSAIEFAVQQNVDLVNASFVARSSSDTFLRVLKESTPPLLVVTAAGNDLDGDTWFGPADQTWPGRFGGDMALSNAPALVLSVGAHGPRGELLAFSRKGRDHVDLLAPGCAIPTYTLSAAGEVESVDLSGTSFAAPLVTMVAGELFKEGLKPVQVRNRILASVDVDPRLDGLVWTSGILNVRKALSVYRDYVRTSRIDPTTGTAAAREFSGTVTNAADVVRCGGVQFAFADIQKLASAPDPAVSGAKRSYLLLKPLSAGGRFLRQGTCTAAELAAAKPFRIVDAADGQQRTVALAEVEDFVARSRTPAGAPN